MNPNLESASSAPSEPSVPLAPTEVIRSKERGESVEVVLMFMRHGERDREGNLKDAGREETRQQAEASQIDLNDFDAIKPIGSNAGPKSDLRMGRALETVHIYSNELAGDEAFRTKSQKELNYETFINPVPYNQNEIYKQNLPADFEELDDPNTVIAAKAAQNAVLNYVINLDTPEAIAYKKEVAGAHATVIEHYKALANRLNPDSKVLIPAGTHGGLMELLLQQALVRTSDTGEKVLGFENANDIGGQFNPSESFNVDIKTNDQGEYEPLKVTFNNPSRPQGEMYLDDGIIKELAEYYKQLHSQSQNLE
jgi:hypothetical protein